MVDKYLLKLLTFINGNFEIPQELIVIIILFFGILLTTPNFPNSPTIFYFPHFIDEEAEVQEV